MEAVRAGKVFKKPMTQAREGLDTRLTRGACINLYLALSRKKNGLLDTILQRIRNWACCENSSDDFPIAISCAKKNKKNSIPRQKRRGYYK